MRRTSLAALTTALLPVPSATASAKLRFFSSPSKTIGCDLEFGSAFALGATGRATRICHGDTVLGHEARVLQYGEATRFGPFTCKVRRTRGMRCTSKTGHGFQLSRERQKLW